MKIYNKLVRDKIPEIIKNSNKKFDSKIVTDKVALELLHAKLDEEVSEFHNDKNLEELADIMEVICSLSKKLGYSEDELLNKRLEKRNSRGGFDKNIVLEKVYE
ncbi:nucleoside triphosphate pyrophosphohydrolase [Clostridium botulinum]|uniref:nucleoside triphosphate pyrophosphohydrolase n=1 Tax=Clostridium botulinum TaxID=1491 RepID=UPI0004D734D6|nr:nucleoside triphosphate pyrophosphohydrolase [Clostridium botulinum]KEH98754.1 phosphoribosyl-ATP pyrophosphohydrolase [Clostridium botulinum D str. 16868]KOA75026.1 phosphoribosyl-ATP pyrophosphohydrolase [Clostridium botulinum]KOA91080.1 phosphoribosyl-ATP pyrophosphohydrolase [Clostridium botulinum]KOC32124.1 phosphoribosyl-ATP pyrophosphohydrolase [Clostridium botulinum]MCD3202951.1 nucleoside triphosphate pyrophosphohydrolase [Clostridium botulinum C/D]